MNVPSAVKNVPSGARGVLFKPGDRVVATIHDNAVGKSKTVHGVVDRVETFQGEPGRIVYVDSPKNTYKGQPDLAWARNIRHEDAPSERAPGMLW